MGWLFSAFKAVKLFTSGHKLLLIIGAAVAIMGSITYYVWSAERAKGQVKTLKAEAKGWDAAVVTLKGALANNESALQECRATNEANTAEIGRISSDLDKAEARVTLLDERTNDQINRIRRDADSIRGTDATCRTLDDPLPDAFVASVRKPAAPDRR